MVHRAGKSKQENLSYHIHSPEQREINAMGLLACLCSGFVKFAVKNQSSYFECVVVAELHYEDL